MVSGYGTDSFTRHSKAPSIPLHPTGSGHGPAEPACLDNQPGADSHSVEWSLHGVK